MATELAVRTVLVVCGPFDQFLTPFTSLCLFSCPSKEHGRSATGLHNAALFIPEDASLHVCGGHCGLSVCEEGFKHAKRGWEGID